MPTTHPPECCRFQFVRRGSANWTRALLALKEQAEELKVEVRTEPAKKDMENARKLKDLYAGLTTADAPSGYLYARLPIGDDPA